MLNIVRSDNTEAVNRLLGRQAASVSSAEAVARRIIAAVRRQGDRALVRYSRQFDGVDLRETGMTVTAQEVERACSEVPRSFVEAVRRAAKNIRAAARRQLPRAWQFQPLAGVEVSQVLRPLERVLCYVPGGRFPLPSTVLMSVIPAQVAGVQEILITSPKPAPAVLVAADILGVQGIYRLGGAQAVAAFAYGTESIPRVQKIVGPGNRFVAAAKKLVAGDCGIDFVAGPSELVVVGSQGSPDWIAADLVAQARARSGCRGYPHHVLAPDWLSKFERVRLDSWPGCACRWPRNRWPPRGASSSSAIWQRLRHSSTAWLPSISPCSTMLRVCSTKSGPPVRSFWALIALSPRGIMLPAPITFCPPAGRRVCGAA